MARNKTDAGNSEASQRENLTLKEKIRRLENERDAVLSRLRELETAGRQHENSAREDAETEPAGNIEGVKKAPRKSRGRYRDLVEQVNDWVWEVDEKGVYTYASPQIRDLLGYEPEEVIGKKPFDLMPDHEGERVGRIFGEIAEKRQPFCALENTNFHKDGRLVVLETSGVPFFDKSGNLLGYRGVDRNITDRRTLERERERLIEEDRRRLALIEAIFDATQDGIAIYDAEGKILRMNGAAEEFLGYTAEVREMDIDRRWDRMRVEKMDGAPLPSGEIPAKRALAGEKIRTVLHFRPPGRPPCWLSVSAAPILATGPNAARAVIILTDITDLYQLQKEQEIFMQMISHDLRTPITVIQGHAEMLQGRISEPDEITTVNLDSIKEGTRQLTGMMEDLARVIHLEKGQLPLEFEPIEVPEFITRLLNRLTLAGIGWPAEKSFPPDLPPVWADAESLERILTNLITNAFMYSSVESPVRVASEVDGENMRISITDHGKGISPEDQLYLFERFFRSRDAGRKRGIGLGLYITRRLVEAHGGSIWVTSEPGKGSMFTFSIPLQQEGRTLS
ncbi:PAS domain S-box protein [Desulfuromonas sp. TF]|uniref:sensor histidine kinase n=1 Tax=Desulfuromonas sp. TF TaxID=1232410 RepID=UPI000412B5CE|nr:PAS domain S-box protein [Desulfuromonas sp. TF]